MNQRGDAHFERKAETLALESKKSVSVLAILRQALLLNVGVEDMQQIQQTGKLNTENHKMLQAGNLPLLTDGSRYGQMLSIWKGQTGVHEVTVLPPK